MTAIYAEVVEKRDVIGRVFIPAVLRADRSLGLAAGVALIHRDDAELVRELGDRVDRRGGLAPDADHRLQARRREGKDREPLAEFFVKDASALVFKARHVGGLL